MDNSNEFRFGGLFDTLNMLLKSIIKDFEYNQVYPLKYLDFLTIVLIGHMPNKPMSVYSQKLNIENGSFNYIANKVEEFGLVNIVIDENDKRKKFLVLTEKGIAENARLRTNLDEHIEKKLSRFTEDEKELFIQSTNNLRELAIKMKEREIK